MRSWQLRSIVASCVLSLGLVSASQAAIQATFEGPGDGDDVAGVQIVRGWTFSDAGTITTVSFLIDGMLNTVIPCCSERQDVAAAFPGQPSARNSGFGLTLNFNLLTPGSHTLTIRVQDSSGDMVSRAHTVTVVRPGGFEFVDLVDLSSASVSRQGQDLLLSGMQLRAAGSGQVAQVDVRLRWLRQLQGLGIVASATQNAVQAPSLQGPQQPLIRPQTGAGLSGLVAVAVESPSTGQTGAGVAVIRGFAVAAAGRSIARVQLFLDGTPSLTIPCCSTRGDVATAFPGEPNALNSGFGITFNFGVLTTGVHQLIIEIEDSAGDIHKIVRGILVRRVGDFEFLNNLDLSQSTASLQGQTLIIEGAIARDSATNQTVSRTLRYRYDIAVQGFSLLDSHGQVVVIDNLGAEENGDISSLDALQADPGPDGISILEAIEATNETPPQEPVLIVFPLPGTVQSAATVTSRLGSVASGQFEDEDLTLSIFSDNITLDGDVDGDGTSDVTLSQVCLEVFARNITIRGLTFTDASLSPLFVSADEDSTSSDVALVDNTVGSALADPVITIETFGENARLTDVLVSGNQVEASGFDGIKVNSVFGVDNVIRGVVIADNVVLGAGDITVDPFGERGKLSQIVVADNQSGGRAAVRNLSRDSSANVVEIMVLNNAFAGDLGGIEINGGEVGNNMVMAEIRGNTVQASDMIAINVRGGTLDGGVGGDNNLIDAMIVDNLVTNADFRGIAVQGGSGAGSGSESDNIVLSTIRNNIVQTSFEGVCVEGGTLGESNNLVNATITENVITRSELSGIFLQSGQSGAFDNTVMAEVQNNRVENAGDRGMFMLAGDRASNNMLDTMVSDNTVTDSDREGILVAGGVIIGMANSAATQQNEAMGMLVDNTVRNSRDTGIAVVAGLLIVGTGVTGNVAHEDLIGNTADGLTCEDGLAGNTAECTLQNNTDTTNSPLSHPNGPYAGQRPVSPAFRQQLTSQIQRLEQKDAQLRTRAAQIDDDRLRQRVIDVSDKLAAVRAKLAARRDGRSPWAEHISID